MASKCLGESADLVHLDEDRVGHAEVDSLLEEVDVGDEEVVADDLNFVADLVGESLSSRPSRFRRNRPRWSRSGISREALRGKRLCSSEPRLAPSLPSNLA